MPKGKKWKSGSAGSGSGGGGSNSYHNGGVEGSGLSSWYDNNLASSYSSGSGSGGSNGSGSGGTLGSGSGGSKGSGSGGTKGSGSGGSKGSGSSGTKGSGSGGTKGSGSGGTKGSGSGGSKGSGSGGTKGSGSGGTKGSGSGGTIGSGSGGSKGSGSGGTKGSGSGGTKGSGSGGTKGSGSGGTDGVPCFCAGTLISTPDGQVAVEDLQPGAAILAADGRTLVLRANLHTQVSASRLAADPKLRPVLIRKGALGHGLPARDLKVSRQHRMLLASKAAQRMFSATEILLPAIRLVQLPGIRVCNSRLGQRYHHLVFDAHEVILAEGAPSESLYLGPQALKALPREALEELSALFPDLGMDVHPVPARPIPGMKAQMNLIRRHRANRTAPLAGYTASCR